MSFATFIKLLWDAKVITMAPGFASLVVLGYVEVFQLMPLEAQVSGVKESVAQLQLSELESKLDAVYTALCMNPGDVALLERIRDLQTDYERIAGKRYDPPSCDLLIKLK